MTPELCEISACVWEGNTETCVQETDQDGAGHWYSGGKQNDSRTKIKWENMSKINWCENKWSPWRWGETDTKIDK